MKSTVYYTIYFLYILDDVPEIISANTIPRPIDIARSLDEPPVQPYKINFPPTLIFMVRNIDIFVISGTRNTNG